MSKPEEGVGVDLTPPSFLRRSQEGERMTPEQIAERAVTEEDGLEFVRQQKAAPEPELELPAEKLPTLEELIALIKSLVGQREAIDEKIRILNRHAEKMLREISKPKR